MTAQKSKNQDLIPIITIMRVFWKGLYIIDAINCLDCHPPSPLILNFSQKSILAQGQVVSSLLNHPQFPMTLIFYHLSF